jgi:hypothetical protein
VLPADVMMGSIKAALAVSEKSLDRVCGRQPASLAVKTSILFFAMVDLIV